MSTPEERTAAKFAALIKAIRKLVLWSVIHTTLLTAAAVAYGGYLLQNGEKVWGFVVCAAGALFAYQAITTLVSGGKMAQVEDDLRTGVRKVTL